MRNTRQQHGIERGDGEGCCCCWWWWWLNNSRIEQLCSLCSSSARALVSRSTSFDSLIRWAQWFSLRLRQIGSDWVWLTDWRPSRAGEYRRNNRRQRKEKREWHRLDVIIIVARLLLLRPWRRWWWWWRWLLFCLEEEEGAEIKGCYDRCFLATITNVIKRWDVIPTIAFRNSARSVVLRNRSQFEIRRSKNWSKLTHQTSTAYLTSKK